MTHFQCKRHVSPYEAMGTRVRVSLRVRVSDRVRAGLRVRIRVIAQSQVGNTLGTTVRGRVRVRVSEPLFSTFL